MGSGSTCAAVVNFAGELKVELIGESGLVSPGDI